MLESKGLLRSLTSKKSKRDAPSKDPPTIADPWTGGMENVPKVSRAGTLRERARAHMGSEPVAKAGVAPFSAIGPSGEVLPPALEDQKVPRKVSHSRSQTETSAHSHGQTSLSSSSQPPMSSPPMPSANMVRLRDGSYASVSVPSSSNPQVSHRHNKSEHRSHQLPLWTHDQLAQDPSDPLSVDVRGPLQEDSSAVDRAISEQHAPAAEAGGRGWGKVKRGLTIRKKHADRDAVPVDDGPAREAAAPKIYTPAELARELNGKTRQKAADPEENRLTDSFFT
ncbi:hypothetical protein [Phaffia rhodozyma]|uniref:Uncharacterized protein n=1 Tax=Phaffia rhodozyma TaxID=264483 RepID=A0A0F7SWB7_PHARH|nr:hypothetical protein [Phaffia rhodozyma]